MSDRALTLRSPLVLLVLGAGFGLLAFVQWPAFSAKFGFLDRGLWFMDSYALLAASEARQAGLDPSEPNPLDVFHRPHSYSSWWFGLGALGLTRGDNFLLGGFMVAAFLAAAVLWLRPRTWREAGWGLAFLLSPPVLLAVNRGNNDLLVAALLMLGAAVLRGEAVWRLAAFGGAVVLATGLKFYPLVAVGGLLAVAAPRRRHWALLVAGVAAGAVLAGEWEWFRRAVIPVPDGLYLYGAGILWRELDVTVGGLSLIGGALLFGFGALAARCGWTRGLAGAAGPASAQVAFVAGALMLLACWLVGLSYAYRWVLAGLLVPWWLAKAAAGDRGAKAGLVLLAFGLWSDGLFCLVLNTWVGALPVPVLEDVQHVWQLAVQPVLWVFHGLLTGWLVELAWVRAKDLWPGKGGRA